MIMKKKLLSAAVISMMSLAVIAQTKPKTTTASTEKQGNFIIKGGLNNANISVTPNGRVDEANTLRTFHAGFAIDLPLGECFSIQPGVLYTGKGAKTQYGKEGSAFYYTATSNPMYIEVPLNLVGK